MQSSDGPVRRKGARLVKFKAADMEILRPIGEMGFATVTDVSAPCYDTSSSVQNWIHVHRLPKARPSGPHTLQTTTRFLSTVGILWRNGTESHGPKHAYKNSRDRGCFHQAIRSSRGQGVPHGCQDAAQGVFPECQGACRTGTKSIFRHCRGLGDEVFLPLTVKTRDMRREEYPPRSEQIGSRL